MTRILYLHNTAEISGGERSLLALWGNLDRTRFELVLAVPCEGALTEKAQALGVECLTWTVPALRPWHLRGILKGKCALERIVAEKKIEIIHSYAPRNNVLASAVGHKVGVPVIWHERNLTYAWEWDISSLLVHLPESIICNSQAVARRFLRFAKIPAKVVVIYNGVDVDWFKPVDVDDAKRRLGLAGRKVVGLVSNLNRRKNVESFLRVAGRLAKKEPLASFVVVGGIFGEAGNERLGELKSLAGRLGVASRIIFTDFQDDVRPYLAAFDVYCAVTEREACSRALLEAMAMGKPCVAFKDGGNPEIVEHGVTGLLAAVDEPSFCRAVEQFLGDEELRHNYGQAARGRVVGNFNVQHQAVRTQDLYSRLREGGHYDIGH